MVGRLRLLIVCVNVPSSNIATRIFRENYDGTEVGTNDIHTNLGIQLSIIEILDNFLNGLDAAIPIAGQSCS